MTLHVGDRVEGITGRYVVTERHLTMAFQIADVYSIPPWMLGLPWRPGTAERPDRSARHAAYAARRRRRTR